MAWRVGVDIGGTFTDVALIDDATGQIGVAKVPTTPRDFAEGVLGALDIAMRRYRLAAADVGLLSHATTVVTNAILQEKGARAALVTTRGFRDVLELRRSARSNLYELIDAVNVRYSIAVLTGIQRVVSKGHIIFICSGHCNYSWQNIYLLSDVMIKTFQC